jgi:laminin alpha 1/2
MYIKCFREFVFVKYDFDCDIKLQMYNKRWNFMRLYDVPISQYFSQHCGISFSRDGQPDQSFYSASVVDGRINVQVDAGRGGIVLSSQRKFNDGKFHSLSVTKIGRRLELRVDDELQDTATLPRGATVVHAPGPSGGLYFGGVPSNFTNTGLAASSVPLIGTIKDVIFNDQ